MTGITKIGSEYNYTKQHTVHLVAGAAQAAGQALP